MDLSKHLQFFDPINDLKAPIHIIGCGAIGSTVAEMLTRMGAPNLYLYDFDIVTPHNIANQMFTSFHAADKMPKTVAMYDMLIEINPEIKITLHGKYVEQPLSGYVFLCVDNIDLRREIVKANLYNSSILAMFDFRMRLTDAQHYAADWSDVRSKEALLNSMAFTHEEAKEQTPTNACGTSLNIIPTVRTIVSFGLSNFINFTKQKGLKKLILVDAFAFTVDAF